MPCGVADNSLPQGRLLKAGGLAVRAIGLRLRSRAASGASTLLELACIPRAVAVAGTADAALTAERTFAAVPAVDPDVSFWQANGYLVKQNVFTPTELADLRAEIGQIARGNRGDIRGLQVTAPPCAPLIVLEPACGSVVQHSGDAARKTDDELMKELLAIHFPHKISPLMKATVGHLTLFLCDAMLQIRLICRIVFVGCRFRSLALWRRWSRSLAPT